MHRPTGDPARTDPPDPRRVDPRVLAALLDRHGWHRTGGARGPYTRWTPPGQGTTPTSLLVPDDRAFPDCDDLLGEALTALTRTADPSAHDILAALAVPSDEVRWHRQTAPPTRVPPGGVGDPAPWAAQDHLRAAAHQNTQQTAGPANATLRWSSDRGWIDRPGPLGEPPETASLPTLAQLTSAEQRWADREEDITTVGGDPFEVGQVFARRWIERLPEQGHVQRLSAMYPRIPHRIDGELLRYAARFGLLTHKDDQIDEHDRYAIRAGFWREIDVRTAAGNQAAEE
ncbi:hypothetical protein ACE14D_17530 [Streptomyces sp. Act-28]